MSLTTAQRQHLEQRLHEERARALRVLNRSVNDLAGATEQDRSFTEFKELSTTSQTTFLPGMNSVIFSIIEIDHVQHPLSRMIPVRIDIWTYYHRHWAPSTNLWR